MSGSFETSSARGKSGVTGVAVVEDADPSRWREGQTTEGSGPASARRRGRLHSLARIGCMDDKHELVGCSRCGANRILSPMDAGSMTGHFLHGPASCDQRPQPPLSSRSTRTIVARGDGTTDLLSCQWVKAIAVSCVVAASLFGVLAISLRAPVASGPKVMREADLEPTSPLSRDAMVDRRPNSAGQPLQDFDRVPLAPAEAR